MGSKYSNRKTMMCGISFDSKKEAYRYLVLLDRVKKKNITELSLQPKFILQEGFRINGVKIRDIYYIADFQYKEGDKIVIEDVKGMKTEVYKIKKKMFLYKYGKDYEFIET